MAACLQLNEKEQCLMLERRVGALLQDQTQLNQRLNRRAAQLRQLTIALVEAEDQERKRLAELLHDDLQQQLVGIHLLLSAAMNGPAVQPKLRDDLDQVNQLIRDAQRICRDTSHELYPAALHQADLPDVLRWLADHSRKLFGLTLDVNLTHQPICIDETVVRFIYRAVRELLCNIAKHAGSSCVLMALAPHDEYVELVIQDDGVGFKPATHPQKQGGLGLTSIRERIESLGGKLVIKSEPGKGCRVSLIVPTSHADDATVG